MRDNPAPAIAQMVAELGAAAFPDRFLTALGALTGAELCSAFRIDNGGRLRVLFAEGAHPTIPSFAQVASLNYAEHYWKQDGLNRRLRGGHGKARVVRQASSAIADPEYRAACYDRAGIAERLTLYQGGPSGLFASGYRTHDTGPFSDEDVARTKPSPSPAAPSWTSSRRSAGRAPRRRLPSGSRALRCGR